MKASFRKLVVVLLAGLILLPIAAYWLADSWLESSGGRRLLEQTLSERIGMSVRLEGEFDLMLLPAIGVSGTDLVIGGPEPGAGKRDSLFARSNEFEISVALRPLLDRKVFIEWIRLTGGSIYPERYPRTDQMECECESGLAQAMRVERLSAKPKKVPLECRCASATLVLPEIQELTIHDFQIVWPPEVEGGDENRLQIEELNLADFAENRETPFTLEIEDLVSAGGTLRWDRPQSLIHFGKLQLNLAGQVVGGTACLFFQSPASLHFDLQAGAFDLDALREILPGTDAAAGQGSGDLPLEIQGRFTVDELNTSGVLARGVVLSLGGEPACD